MSGQDFRMTRQRKLILEELRKSKSHPTADQVYTRIREVLPRVSLGTVYRNLDALSDMGMILKLDGCGTQKRYDGDINEHHHIKCAQCGKVDDIPLEAISGFEVNTDHMNGYNLLGHTILFSGICDNCSRQEGSC
ncbi:Fur family transcriptional regulator [Candidatus Latescibacterota bacterium]